LSNLNLLKFLVSIKNIRKGFNSDQEKESSYESSSR